MKESNTTMKRFNKFFRKYLSRILVKVRLPILYVLPVVLLSACSSNYKQQFIGIGGSGSAQEHMAFTTPPHSTLPTSKGAYKVNSKHRYQALLIENISMNYNEMLSYTSEGTLLTYKDQKHLPTNLKQPNILKVDNPWLRIILFEHKQSKKILIEIDYDKIFKFDCDTTESATEADRNRDCIKSKFEKLSHDVLNTLAEYESLSSSKDKSLNLPYGIALEILIKLFETVPYPESASLSRYGMVQKDYHMVLFLHPSMRLIVDTTEKIKPPDDIYQLKNSSFLYFQRNNRGEISQIPYFENTSLDKQTTFEAKQPGDTKEFVILASTADLHYSSATRSSNYIALLQMPMKNSFHSNHEHLSDDDASDCCKKYECQSVILYGLPNQIIAPEANKFCEGVIPEYKNKAVFGERSYISVEFPIYINNTKIYVQVGSTVATLLQQDGIPRNFKLFRKHKGKYLRFKTEKNIGIQLIPGDRIDG